jgi:protease I
MGQTLQNKTVAFLTANEGVEQIELTSPWEAVLAEGGTAVLIAPDQGDVQAFNHLDRGDVFQADLALSEADPESFDALVLPGGVANPDQLRTDPEAIRFIRVFWETGRPLAAICHAPWLLADAGLVEDRQLTSWPSLRFDLSRAGADWSDEEVVVDENIITSRNPDDLPVFNQTLLSMLTREHLPT